jgi:hypothetical protein
MNDCVYVDKTKEIYQMITSGGGAYFLSRPRRFGKSLLISTLQELFLGNESLFKGLYIHDKWDWTRKYPVIRIDWTLISHATSKEIEDSLLFYFRNIALKYEITLTGKSATNCFAELIRLLHEKTGEKVVTLVDEYDVPILDVMNSSSKKPEVIRKKLHTIYKVIKGSDDHLQFVFLTGVSKFAGLSVFSALNNLNDITLKSKYATLCGYTQQEMESYFAEYIDNMAQSLEITGEKLLSEIRKWYNGYSWDGKTTVYNPFSTLLLFDEKRFGNFWFATGTPTFLIDLLKKRNDIESFLQPIRANDRIFSSYDPERPETLPLLFQTGYLTIKGITQEEEEDVYTLAAPNMEVRKSFIQNLFTSYTHLHLDEMIRLHESMIRRIKMCDAAGLEQSLRAMIARVPYQLHVEAEKYYHSLLLVWLYFMGFKAQGEMPTNIGRIDAVWQLPDITVIAEVKYDAKRPLKKLLDEAMTQIHDKKYYEACHDKKIILLGVAFSGKEIACRMENIG